MYIVLLALSAVCATVPMVGFLLLVWWFDRHDREPLWLVGLTFSWGGIGSILLALLGSELMMAPLRFFMGAGDAERLAPVIVAPLIEEPMKALILFVVMLSRHFDNTTDGFVYGAAAGLGFGMTENFFYFTSAAASGSALSWAYTVLVRTFFSALMHGCATAIVGAAIGFVRFRRWPTRLIMVPAGFVVAMGIHALWNGLWTWEELGHGDIGWYNFILFPFEAMLLMIIFQLALWDERATIRRELADEVLQGLIPLDHASAIAGYFSRNRTDWLPAGVPHRQYVRAATTLALRKHQCRNASARSYPFYSEEVLRLRREIQALLSLGRA